MACTSSASATAVPNSPSPNASRAPATSRPNAGVEQAIASKKVRQCFGLHGAEKPHPLTHSHLRGERLETNAIIPFSRHQITDIMALLHQLRHCGDYPVVAFVSFLRIHPSHGQQNALALD